jgi:hypothetical protein
MWPIASICSMRWFVGYWEKALPARLGDQRVRSHSLSLPK